MLPEQEFALEWLKKAEHDLLAAKAVLESEYGITDVPCFHAQQTVEKAFKGFLTWHNVSFVKTHDLMVLLAAVVEIDPAFLACRTICEELAEFAVDVRYPGGISEPPEGEAEHLFSEAEKIFNRIDEMLVVE